MRQKDSGKEALLIQPICNKKKDTMSQYTKGFDVPILLVIFNRPEWTREVFEAIRRVRPQQLFIGGDGPRSDHPEDADLCNKARAVAEMVDWDCKVCTQFHNTNMGCRMGPVSAINWFFSQIEYGIILEDDIVPVPSFFHFCEEMLVKYRGISNIGMVSGCNPFDVQTNKEESYHFSSYTKTWGWATWAQVWNRYYDVTGERYLSVLPEIRARRPLTKKFHKWWWTNLELTLNHGFDAWDFQWELAHYANDLLIIRPKANLIKYIGVGDNATHSFSVHKAYTKIAELEFPLVHPKSICWDKKADLKLEKSLSGSGLLKQFLYLPWRTLRYILRKSGIYKPRISDSYARILNKR